jgi:hypothetical protein
MEPFYIYKRFSCLVRKRNGMEWFHEKEYSCYMRNSLVPPNRWNVSVPGANLSPSSPGLTSSSPNLSNRIRGNRTTAGRPASRREGRLAGGRRRAGGLASVASRQAGWHRRRAGRWACGGGQQTSERRRRKLAAGGAG